MALKIKNREEAIAVLRDMIQRKKEMEKHNNTELWQTKLSKHPKVLRICLVR